VHGVSLRLSLRCVEPYTSHPDLRIIAGPDPLRITGGSFGPGAIPTLTHPPFVVSLVVEVGRIVGAPSATGFVVGVDPFAAVSFDAVVDFFGAELALAAGDEVAEVESPGWPPCDWRARAPTGRLRLR